jgi:SAM-dependent methyltransferase
MSHVKYSPELIIEINRAFHDINATDYSHEHEEIFVDEVTRWKSIVSELTSIGSRPLRLMDVGTGTGFVPLAFSSHLSSEDEFHCVDVSQAMLDVCRDKFASCPSPAKYSFFLSDGYSLPDIPAKFDIITANSVLHHLPSPYDYAGKLYDRLNDGGFLVLGHEPNSAFAGSVAIRIASRIFKAGPIYLWPGKFFRRLLTAVKSRDKKDVREAHATLTGSSDDVIHSLNERLRSKGIQFAANTMHDVWTVTDCHDFHTNEKNEILGGIDIQKLLSELKGAKVHSFETYAHLHKVRDDSFRVRLWNRCLKFVLPRSGSTLTIVIRKSI